MIYILISLAFTAVFAAIAYNKEEKVLCAVVSTLVFLFLGAVNYGCLPVIQFWGFEGVWLELLFVTFAGALIQTMERDEIAPKYFIPSGIVVLVLLFAWIQSAECFHSTSFYERLTVKTAPDSCFNSSVHPIDVSKMISVDDKLARKVAEDKLSEDLGLGSRVEVGKMTMQNITGSFTINNGKKLVFNEDLVWVAPLEHISFWKWVSNDYTPGYVLVYATDASKRYLVTEINGEPLKLKYLESGYFGDDIERHIKANGYAFKGLNDHCFEIDGTGRPYWVLSSYDQKIGFCGEESEGPITVDAQTGELKAYSIADAPEWIDRIQPKDFVEEQIRNWGEYKDGWWNSWLQQVGVLRPTQGTTLVYSNGHSYWYTGIQSAGANEGTSGFMLVDTRTKEATFYRTAGVNETEAVRIAEDQPFAKAAGYRANFPVLYNVRGIPTYFMIMKGASGNVVGYCFIAVNNRQAVGCGGSKQDAEAAYLRMLKKVQHDKIADGTVTAKSLELTVRGIVQESSVYYVLFEEIKGFEFTGSTEFFPELKWTNVGDKVKVVYNEGQDKIIPLDSFDNINFEI